MGRGRGPPHPRGRCGVELDREAGHGRAASYLSRSEVPRRAPHTRRCSSPPGRHMTLHLGRGQSHTRPHLGQQSGRLAEPRLDTLGPASGWEGSLSPHHPLPLALLPGASLLTCLAGGPRVPGLAHTHCRTTLRLASAAI